MNLALNMDILSLAEFARDTREHSDRLRACGRPTVLTQDDGKPAAVVMPLHTFQQMAADAYEHQMDRHLQEAVAGYAAGDRGTSAREFFDGLHQEDQADAAA